MAEEGMELSVNEGVDVKQEKFNEGVIDPAGLEFHIANEGVTVKLEKFDDEINHAGGAGMELTVSECVTLKLEKSNGVTNLVDTGNILINGVDHDTQAFLDMDMVYDEETPVNNNDVVMEAQSSLDMLHQSSHLRPTPANGSRRRPLMKHKKRLYLERKRHSHSYNNYRMTLKMHSLELELKIKEALLKKCQLDIQLTRMERQIKEFKLRRVELELAKSKLEFAILQKRNRALTI